MLQKNCIILENQHTVNRYFFHFQNLLLTFSFPTRIKTLQYDYIGPQMDWPFAMQMKNCRPFSKNAIFCRPLFSPQVKFFFFGFFAFLWSIFSFCRPKWIKYAPKNKTFLLLTWNLRKFDDFLTQLSIGYRKCVEHVRK